MDAPKTTDPAIRLITILQSALGTPTNQAFLNFWATGFGVAPENVVDIYYNLGLLRELVDDLERAINQIPDLRHEQYLKVLAPLRDVIAQPNLQAGWNQHAGVLKMVINGLEFASERLQAYSPEPDLAKSELDAIRQQTDELLEKLQQSETIPKALKLILFDLLSAVQQSISEYRFRGIRGVRQELFVIASRIQEHLPEFEKAKDAPEVKSFFSLLKKIDSITAAALHVKELISAVAPLLPLIPALVEHLPK